MTGALPSRESHGNLAAHWILVFAFPLLLAADVTQRSNQIHQLPDHDSYRSNFSDRALKSSRWRQPIPESLDWRVPASPKTEWRTDPTQKSPRMETPGNLDLYPNYSPGGPSTFDLSTREDQSLIKIFEFDFSR